MDDEQLGEDGHTVALGRMHHVVLDAGDPAGVAEFWSALLGQPLTYRSPDWVVVARGQAAHLADRTRTSQAPRTLRRARPVCEAHPRGSQAASARNRVRTCFPPASSTRSGPATSTRS